MSHPAHPDPGTPDGQYTNPQQNGTTNNGHTENHVRSNRESGKTRELDGYGKSSPKSPLSILARLEHFTWAQYTWSMSTGGISLLLSESTQPNTFTGLQTIGKVVYIIDLCVFSLITTCIVTRFLRYKGTFLASLTHATEGMFSACCFLSMASIIGSMARYGIPSCGEWLVIVYRVLFWIYYAVTLIHAIGMYMVLFTSPQMRISDMTPAWDLHIFPFMLSGTLATIGASYQPPAQAVPMIIAGLTAQGLGMLVSMMMYGLYLHRMIQFGLPAPRSRPGLFIAVGPPGFTALALIGLAKAFPAQYKEYFGASDVTAQVLSVVATMTGVFIWSLGLWFFGIALGAVLLTAREMPFSMSWYAFVFPNVGFTISTIEIGKAFESPGVEGVGSGMTILLILTYLTVFTCHMRAVVRGDILAEGKDEDVYIDELRHKYGKFSYNDQLAEKQA